jgi:hypothetical protein
MTEQFSIAKYYYCKIVYCFDIQFGNFHSYFICLQTYFVVYTAGLCRYIPLEEESDKDVNRSSSIWQNRKILTENPLVCNASWQIAKSNIIDIQFGNFFHHKNDVCKFSYLAIIDSFEWGLVLWPSM